MKPSARWAPPVRSAILVAGGCWASIAVASSATAMTIDSDTRRMRIPPEIARLAEVSAGAQDSSAFLGGRSIVRGVAMRMSLIVIIVVLLRAVPAGAQITDLERQRLIAHLQMTASW